MALKIAYISIGDPRSVRYWSSIPFSTVRELRRLGHKVTCVGPLSTWPKIIFAPKKAFYCLMGSSYQPLREPLMGKMFAYQIRRQLHQKSYDLAIADSTIPIAALDTDLPLVYWTDAVVDQMIGYYSSNIWNLADSHGQTSVLQEQKALDLCTRAFYASSWSAEYVIKNYNVDEGKVNVRPFGPNLPVPQVLTTSLDERPPLSRACCRLLFVGIDWQRKGGEIALQAVAELRRQDVHATMTVVGVSMFAIPEQDGVNCVGFVDYSTLSGIEVMQELFRSHHFLILPTKAEALGIVFVEAAGFGLPSLATRTGGVPSVVVDGKTGVLFDPEEKGTKYAEKIIMFIERPDDWRELCASARQIFDEQFSWQVIGREFEAIL